MSDDHEPTRVVVGEHVLCPGCTLGALVERGELEAYDTPEEVRHQGIAMIVIRQEVQTPGAPARLYFLCPECGRGKRLVVNILREEDVQVPVEDLEP